MCNHSTFQTEKKINLPSACPACVCLSFASHVSNCPSVSKEGELPRHFQVEEAVSDKDCRKFFELFYRVYQTVIDEDETQIQRRVELNLKYLKQPASSLSKGAERHVYIIRDQDKTIAGAELFIGQKNQHKEAYLWHKVVDERYRGQKLANLLVEKRIDVARESGCIEAWSLIEGNNVVALRSITKDGFVVRSNGMKKTGNEMVRYSYYVSRDLSAIPTKPLTIAEIENIPQVHSSDQLQGGRVLIALEDRTLIEQAFDSEYEGRQIILPKDSDIIERPMMFLKRVRENNFILL